jgi:hypothetical protein
MWQLAVISIVDSVEVRGVTVNHGNCVVEKSWTSPVTTYNLKFGKEAKYYVRGCDPLLEIKIATDQGDSVFSRQ